MQLDQLERLIDQAIQLALQDIADVALHTARSTTKFHASDTFKHNIKFEKLDSHSGFIVSKSPWSYYLEEGNDQQGPRIYPVKAKALHFFWKGEEFFRKSVKSHPGYHFLRDARDEAHSKGTELLAKRLSEALR